VKPLKLLLNPSAFFFFSVFGSIVIDASGLESAPPAPGRPPPPCVPPPWSRLIRAPKAVDSNPDGSVNNLVVASGVFLFPFFKGVLLLFFDFQFLR